VHDREAFLKAVGGGLPAVESSMTPKRNTPESPVRKSPSSLDPAWLAVVKQNLSRYMGPIAPRLVDRAVKKAANRRELLEALANEIPSERDRQAFLALLPQ
jgi:hypothetical protein